MTSQYLYLPLWSTSVTASPSRPATPWIFIINTILVLIILSALTVDIAINSRQDIADHICTQRGKASVQHASVTGQSYLNVIISGFSKLKIIRYRDFILGYLYTVVEIDYLRKRDFSQRG